MYYQHLQELPMPQPACLTEPADDRRAYRRAPLDVLANRFLDGQPYLCRTTDISSDGLRLHRLQEPSAKTRVRFIGVQFQLPGSADILTASGEVVINDEQSRAISLRFTYLSPATAAAIDDFVHGVPGRARSAPGLDAHIDSLPA
jgi:c-di-GMP-binding flagellar brake protein YcgR